jgi:hypothetical protein
MAYLRRTHSIISSNTGPMFWIPRNLRLITWTQSSELFMNSRQKEQQVTALALGEEFSRPSVAEPPWRYLDMWMSLGFIIHTQQRKRFYFAGEL